MGIFDKGAEPEYTPPTPNELALAERLVSEYFSATANRRSPRPQLLELSQASGFTGSRTEAKILAREPNGPIAMRSWRWLTDVLRLDGVDQRFALRAVLLFTIYLDQTGPRIDVGDIQAGMPPCPSDSQIAAFADVALPAVAGAPLDLVVESVPARTITAEDVIMRLAYWAHRMEHKVSPATTELVGRLVGQAGDAGSH